LLFENSVLLFSRKPSLAGATRFIRSTWFSRKKKNWIFKKQSPFSVLFGESHEKNKRNYVLPLLVEFQEIIVLSNFKQNLQNLKTMKKTWKLLKKHENYEKNKNSFQKIVFRFLLLLFSERTINFLVRSFCYTFQFFLSIRLKGFDWRAHWQKHPDVIKVNMFGISRSLSCFKLQPSQLARLLSNWMKAQKSFSNFQHFIKSAVFLFGWFSL